MSSSWLALADSTGKSTDVRRQKYHGAEAGLSIRGNLSHTLHVLLAALLPSSPRVAWKDSRFP